jgi:hypothetical protein
MLTMHDDAELRRQAESAGAAAYLSKTPASMSSARRRKITMPRACRTTSGDPPVSAVGKAGTAVLWNARV